MKFREGRCKQSPNTSQHNYNTVRCQALASSLFLVPFINGTKNYLQGRGLRPPLDPTYNLYRKVDQLVTFSPVTSNQTTGNVSSFHRELLFPCRKVTKQTPVF